MNKANQSALSDNSITLLKSKLMNPKLRKEAKK
ncbi:MAG: hypothetical protein ACJATA_001468 [Sphingobacteriales bacterium]